MRRTPCFCRLRGRLLIQWLTNLIWINLKKRSTPLKEDQSRLSLLEQTYHWRNYWKRIRFCIIPINLNLRRIIMLCRRRISSKINLRNNYQLRTYKFKRRIKKLNYSKLDCANSCSKIWKNCLSTLSRILRILWIWRKIGGWQTPTRE